MTIAASQNRRGTGESSEVDKRIDAKLPKHELGVNVRSRKTSHYLGLFKDNENEQRPQEESITAQAHDLSPITEGLGALDVGTYIPSPIALN